MKEKKERKNQEKRSDKLMFGRSAFGIICFLFFLQGGLIIMIAYSEDTPILVKTIIACIILCLIFWMFRNFVRTGEIIFKCYEDHREADYEIKRIKEEIAETEKEFKYLLNKEKDEK